MESVAGHNALLGLHGRKEWRAVAEGSGRDRVTADGSMDHGRANGSARMKPLHSENSRNGPIFHSEASSGSSSDSDHHTSDAKHAVVSSNEPLHQNGEDNRIYDEEPVSNGHSSSASNGMPLDFGALNISKHETLEQRLHSVIRQREHLQRVEAELRAQFIARSELLRVQSSFDEQAKQHANIVSNLQEQLQEQDHRFRELELKLEERERQLHVNQKEASEAVNQVWAKDGLLREQTSELASLRRERETFLVDQKATVTQFESDRKQLLSQIQDLEDQVQEKDRQLQEMDGQHRTSQESLSYKDEQLREAQAWVQRAQELDAFYANSHNSLHAELRDRNEQLNQLWLGQQRQLAEVERYHSQAILRLRMEVAEVREQNRVLKSGSSGNVDSKSEQSLHAISAENDHSGATDVPLKLRKGAATGSNRVEHDGALPVPASPVFAAAAPVLAGNPIPVHHQFAGQAELLVPKIAAASTQITKSSFSNPMVMSAQPPLPLLHQQAMHCKLIQQPQPSQLFSHPPSLPVYSHFPDTKSPISIRSRIAHHQHQQIEEPGRDQVVIDQGDIDTGMDLHHMNSAPGNKDGGNMHVSVLGGHSTHQESSSHVEKQLGQAMQEKNVKEEKILYGLGKDAAFQDSERSIQQWQRNIDQFCEDKDLVKDVDSMRVFPQHTHPIKHHMELRNNTIGTDDMEQHNAMDSKVENHQISSQGSAITSIDSQVAQVNLRQIAQSNAAVLTSVVPQMSTAEGNGKAVAPVLLDEKSLLACLVRAIPSEPSACIKISTTLPNRLGKILAPLHWHDYKKQYGRLDDFIGSHPQLFVIDGDFVHLREGAQAIISATTAVAKVAAAAAAPSTFGTKWPPTVAVTPVAHSQIQRMRKISPPALIGAKEVPGSAGNQIKQENNFSHMQMNGTHWPHQDFASKDAFGEKQAPQHSQKNIPLNGIASPVSVLRTRSGGTPSSSTNSNFVEILSSSHGASSATRKSEMSFKGRQGARSSTLEAEPFVGKELPGLSQLQEDRIPSSS